MCPFLGELREEKRVNQRREKHGIQETGDSKEEKYRECPNPQWRVMLECPSNRKGNPNRLTNVKQLWKRFLKENADGIIDASENITKKLKLK